MEKSGNLYQIRPIFEPNKEEISRLDALKMPEIRF